MVTAACARPVNHPFKPASAPAASNAEPTAVELALEDDALAKAFAERRDALDEIYGVHVDAPGWTWGRPWRWKPRDFYFAPAARRKIKRELTVMVGAARRRVEIDPNRPEVVGNLRDALESLNRMRAYDGEPAAQ